MNDILETLFYVTLLIAIWTFFYNKLFPSNKRINMQNLSEDIEKMYNIKTDIQVLEELLTEIETCTNHGKHKVLTLSWVTDTAGDNDGGQEVTYNFYVVDKRDYLATAFKYLIANETSALKSELQHDTKYLRHRSEKNVLLPRVKDFKIQNYLYKHFKDN